MRVFIYLLVALLASCGGSDSESNKETGGSGFSPSIPDGPISNTVGAANAIVNDVSEAEFKESADDVTKPLENIEGVTTEFSESQTSFAAGPEYEASLIQEDQSVRGFDGDQIKQYFSNLKACGDAFDGLGDLGLSASVQQLKASLLNQLEQLKNGKASEFSSANEPVLTKLDSSADAIAYKLSSPTNVDGIVLSGKISARQNKATGVTQLYSVVKSVTDFSKLFKNLPEFGDFGDGSNFMDDPLPGESAEGFDLPGLDRLQGEVTHYTESTVTINSNTNTLTSEQILKTKYSGQGLEGQSSDNESQNFEVHWNTEVKGGDLPQFKQTLTQKSEEETKNATYTWEMKMMDATTLDMNFDISILGGESFSNGLQLIKDGSGCTIITK